MTKEWSSCKKILCIRADNMGDVIMTTPALRALKETFHCQLTLLTSRMGAIIAPSIPLVDETIVFDLPWVRANNTEGPDKLMELIARLKTEKFDAAIIFTVFSQNPMPAIMIAYMAGIPLRAAFCRENPYGLLTHWLPDKEPYSFIQHQVKRDLELVSSLGASTSSERLCLLVGESAEDSMREKLHMEGISLQKPFVIFHPGVSETKREYPDTHWIKLGQLCASKLDLDVIVSGSSSEKELCNRISKGIGARARHVAGLLSIEEFIALLNLSPLIVSVNTGTVHIASALMKPIVVLYAMTNPQHVPWITESKVFYYSVKSDLQSKNEVLQYLQQQLYKEEVPYPEPEEILPSVKELLSKEALMNCQRIYY